MTSAPSPSLTVRPARVEDVDAMFVVRTSVAENTLTPGELAALGVTPQAIAEAIGSAPCAWVAEAGGRIVGFSMVDQEDACLFAAFVLPACEGRGIGRLLVREAEAALFAQHAAAWLETAADSRAAGFYRRLGWGNETDVGAGDVRMEKRRPG